jgi:hypothetical protein
MLAGGTIELGEIATSEILDPCQVEGCIPVSVPGTFYRALAGLVNRDHA